MFLNLLTHLEALRTPVKPLVLESKKFLIRWEVSPNVKDYLKETIESLGVKINLSTLGSYNTIFKESEEVKFSNWML